MNAFDDYVSCHRYARLRPHRTGGATDPLSGRMRQDLRPFDSGKPGRSSQTGATFVAGRRWGDFGDSSLVRTHAQSRAGIEFPRARVPYTAGCESPAATPLRTAAQAQYRRRYRSAFGHRRPPTGAPRPYVVHEHPGAVHPLTRWPWNTAHRAYHHSHDTEVWKASPRHGSGRVQTSISAPRPSNHQQCLPVHFVQPIVVDGSFNRLKPRAISGEMTTPSGTGACEMRSTGTGSDAVFAHAAPHSGPCAVRPPHDDVPCRTDRGHLTIAGRDVSCATGLSRPRDERLSAVESSPIAGDIHCSTQKISGMYRPPQRNDCRLSRLDSDNDAHRCAVGDPVPLTGSLSETPHRQPHLLSASQTDDPNTSMMFIANTMTLEPDR